MRPNRSLFSSLHLSAALATALALGLSSCGGGDYGNYAGDFGATQGGVQDMSLARELIAAGQVPPPEAFVVEGMFSEHELGLQGAPCDTLLCLRSGIGVAPALDGTPSGWMQVGLSSTIDPDTYQRPSLTIIATVDVSGSMGWDLAHDPEYPTPGYLARQLLRQLSTQLGAGDRIAIVTYGSEVNTPLPLTSGSDQAAIANVIEGLGTAGSTNMEAGMQRAYEIATEAVGQTAETRVILFTDAQPNVGATTGSQFEQMAAEGAQQGVGLTVLGLGLGLGQEVMLAMSHLRGGNAFSFSTQEHVDTFMADDWPWFTSPIAYDLSLHVATTAGYRAADAYGFPANADGEVGFDVATVFLSRRKGALLVRIENELAEELGDFRAVAHLAYQTLDGQNMTQDLEGAYTGQPLDERGQYFEQPSVAKTTALALLVSGMKEAAELYASEPASATEHMRAVTERFDADALALDDPALEPEVTLAHDLLTLMESGAPQGDLYPY